MEKSKHGQILSNAYYDTSGLFPVKAKGSNKFERNVGFVDTNDNIVIPFKYDYAFSFINGYAVVRLNNKWGFIDRKGKEVIPLKYERACSFTEYGLAGVKLNGKCGFIDINENVIIPFKYEEVSDKYCTWPCGNIGLGPVMKDGKWGIIDRNEKIIIPFKYGVKWVF